MGLDVWFREDVVRVLAAVAVARDGLTPAERTLLQAICTGFDLRSSEVLPPEVQVIEQLPAASEGDGVDGRR